MSVVMSKCQSVVKLQWEKYKLNYGKLENNIGQAEKEKIVFVQ